MTTTPHYSKTSGTSAQLIAEQYTECLVALDALQDQVEGVDFNSRDYSVVAFTAAAAERSAIFEKLKAVRAYFEAHLDAALDA